MGLRISDDGGLDPVAKRVAEFVTGQVGGEGIPPPAAGGDLFQQRLAGFRQTRRSRKWFMVGMASAVTVFVVALVGSRFGDGLPANDLSYNIDGSEPSPGQYVPVSKSAESLLTFSDGSQVKMLARTRGRVVDLSRRGARFALEEGKVSVQVVHRPKTQWHFEAGPFLVTVHGTSFSIAWNPIEALFEMRLQSGTVSVTGPIAEREVWLRPGQVLRVDLRNQSSTIGTIGLPAAAGPPKMDQPDQMVDREVGPPAVAPDSPQEVTRMRPSSPRWVHRDWSLAVAEGNATAVLAEADRRGLPEILDQAASEDLWALANAARYVGRYSLARQVLAAQRRRFPSSDRAREAAFFLGRLDDGSASGAEKALGWYDRYLAEAPNGTHASDALGRKMTVLQRTKRRDEAVAVARDYLGRFPHGIYANAARALIRAHR